MKNNNIPFYRRWTVTQIILLAACVLIIFGIGYKLGEAKAQGITPVLFSSSSATKPNNIDLSLFWEVWNEVQQKYVDKSKINAKTMVYGAIKGMVASLGDPYTFFLTPDENQQTKDTLGGRFEGVGMELGLKDNHIVVVSPLKDTPAQKAGIQAGDFVEKVDNVSTAGWTLVQAVSKIRGQKGTTVRLTVVRGDKEIVIPIVRDVIHISSVDLSYEHRLDCTANCPQVAYVKINQFGDSTDSEWDAAVNEVRQKWQQKQIVGMVLDVRNNPGGYLDSAVYLASDLLPQNDLVVKQESTTEENRDYMVDRTGRLLNIPLVVLINQGSASASEILSGALRDHKRAILVGEKSFGKGSVQEASDLPNGAGLHVTIAKWILPNGDWINQKGIEPTIKVDNTIKEGNTQTRADDMQLETAIKQIIK